MKKLALTDFAKYRYPSALELSPDSRYLTFALKEVDREGDGYPVSYTHLTLPTTSRV